MVQVLNNKDYIKKEYNIIKEILNDKEDLFINSKKIILFANYLIEKKEKEYYFKLLSLIRFKSDSNDKKINIPILAEVLNEEFIFKSEEKEIRQKQNSEYFEINYINIKKRINNKEDIISYSKIILNLSKKLLEKKEYILHEKLTSLVRFRLREDNSCIYKKNIIFCIPCMLYEENVINEELYEKYKEKDYLKISEKDQYYYLKDNEYLFDKYYKNIEVKEKLKYNLEYFINKFKKNKRIIKIKFSNQKRKIIIKSI